MCSYRQPIHNPRVQHRHQAFSIMPHAARTLPASMPLKAHTIKAIFGLDRGAVFFRDREREPGEEEMMIRLMKITIMIELPHSCLLSLNLNHAYQFDQIYIGFMLNNRVSHRHAS
jgi:hypothetical protein